MPVKRDALLEALSSSNWFQFHVPLAVAIGPMEAILLGYLMDLRSYAKKEDKLRDGWFYCTRDKLDKELPFLGLNAHTRLLKRLVDLGLVTTKQIGIRYIRINETAIQKVLENAG